MATLKELWEAYDKSKLPMRVRQSCWDSGDYFEAYSLCGENPYILSGKLLIGKNGWHPEGYYITRPTADWELMPKTRKVERWLWVSKCRSGYLSTADQWRTREEVEEYCSMYGFTLIGKDPNCLIPLVTEVEE